jgi:hypothetical protein
MKAKLFLVFIGLTFGGYVYQSFKPDPDFMVVAERSYFQGWALLTYWFMERFIWNHE